MTRVMTEVFPIAIESFLTLCHDCGLCHDRVWSRPEGIVLLISTQIVLF